MKKISYIFASILLTASLSGCNDFLDVTPSDQYSDASVFTSTEGAQQVLIGAYDWFTNGHYAHYTNQYIFFMPDVMADDAMVNSTGKILYYSKQYLFCGSLDWLL